MIIGVVGNAASLFSKKNGSIIDSCDMVIRFNGGVIKDIPAQGTKTTIIVYSTFSRAQNKFGRVEKWNTKRLSMFDKEKQDLFNIIGKKPSNGILILEKLKNDYKDHKVRIFGFDWNETPTWYNNRRTALASNVVHDYVKEKEYCMKLIKTMKWELY